MTGRVCSCCSGEALVVLKPRGDAANSEPTVVCPRCDWVKKWPVTIRALRKR